MKLLLDLGRESHGLYLVPSTSDFGYSSSYENICCFNSVKFQNVSDLWHCRMDHMPYTSMKHIGCIPLHSKSNKICQICPQARQVRSPFTSSTSNSVRVFDMLHIDVWGPYHHPTQNGHSLFLTIVDDYSRCTWTFLMSHKSNSFNLLQTFISLIETQFKAHVKIIRSDNALELTAGEAPRYFNTKGIIHQTSCIETPQQNGRVERKHTHLLETARALYFQSHVPMKYWGECVLTAIYLINRMPLSVLQYQSPYEKLHKRKPSYSHLKAFDCLCFASTIKQNRKKFQPRADPCVFLGYPNHQKGYKLINLHTSKVFVSRDVVFH